MSRLLARTVFMGRRASGRGWFLKAKPEPRVRPYDFVARQRTDASAETEKDRPHVEFTITVPAETEDDEAITRTCVLELANDVVPQTCERFLTMCQREHPLGYIHSCINRFRPDFVVEAGNLVRTKKNESLLQGVMRVKNDELETAAQLAEVAPEAFEPIPDENYWLRHSVPGVVSLQSAGRDTATTLFTLLLKEAPHLDGRNVAFGRVVYGLTGIQDLFRQLPQVAGRPSSSLPNISNIRILEQDEAHRLRGWIEGGESAEAAGDKATDGMPQKSAEDRKRELLEKARARKR
eukprot:TRINITY_DN19994_c0_g1_i1.p1 TRINITY_DN19994_c0_g1~~TRINITY_DN19994_c0_g1_i1.p1  ORF type:complete len:293 (-),score=27.30 TRINITY_DN19994_c0_g1_i1:136-1014(-)